VSGADAPTPDAGSPDAGSPDAGSPDARAPAVRAAGDATPARRPGRRRSPSIPLVALWVVAAVGALHFARPVRPLLAPPHAVEAVTADEAPRTPLAHVAVGAFERSGGVRMRFTLPGADVRLPLSLSGDTAALRYVWLPVDDDGAGATLPRPLGARLVAPEAPGFYRLAVERDGQRQLVDDVTLSVLVPFGEKRGATLHGYRLGTYVGERLGRVARATLPMGFFPVAEEALALPVSEHLRLGDVLTTPDTPARGLPQYATLDTRLLEKLELVMAEVAKHAGRSGASPRITVNSGFRPPSYNRTVKGAARDSRHQYGDAADVKIDVNRDGRFTMDEVRLVARAVETVEREHPDLAGGMGVYAGKRLRSPYVHIDARGRRARWNGPG